MKKIVRLTESDLVRLVKRVIKEQGGVIVPKVSKLDTMSAEEEIEMDRKMEEENRYIQSIHNKINADSPVEINVRLLKEFLVGRGVTFYEDKLESKPLKRLISSQGIKIIDFTFDERFATFELTFKDVVKTFGADIENVIWDCARSANNQFKVTFNDGQQMTVYQESLSKALSNAFCTKSKAGTPVLKTGGFTQNKTNRPPNNMA